MPLPTRISTMLLSTDSLSGGEHGITASSAVSLIIRPDGACYRKVNTGWPAFAVAGPRAWNNLPDAFRHSPSLETFKRSLKSHLFLQCFLLSLSFLVFVWQLWLRTVPLKWLCVIYSTLQIDYFTLHYRTGRCLELLTRLTGTSDLCENYWRHCGKGHSPPRVRLAWLQCNVWWHKLRPRNLQRPDPQLDGTKFVCKCLRHSY